MRETRSGKNSIASAVTAGILVLIFAGSYAVVLQHNMEAGAWPPACLLIPAAAVGATLFCCGQLRAVLCDILIRNVKDMLVGAGLFIFVFSIVLFLVSLVSSRVLGAELFHVERKWLYDVLVIVAFPSLCILLEKILTGNASMKRRLLVSAVILAANLWGSWYFRELPGAYLAEMGMLNVVTVSGMVFSLETEEGRKGNKIAVCIFYGLWWLGLLAAQAGPGRTFTSYMYGGDWSGRTYAVGQLVDNAVFFRQAPVFRNWKEVESLLLHSRNPVHSLLYYFGWFWLEMYGGLLILFLVLMYRFLGRRYRKYKRCYPIYQAAFANLLFRCVLGALYSFSAAAFPIALPFHGTVALTMDSVCFGLLLYSELFENRNIRDRSELTGPEGAGMSGRIGRKIAEYLTENRFLAILLAVAAAAAVVVLWSGAVGYLSRSAEPVYLYMENMRESGPA